MVIFSKNVSNVHMKSDDEMKFKNELCIFQG